MTIVLEMTQVQANVCLESAKTERVRFRKFLDRRELRGENPSPQALANLDALDYLVSTLKAKTGCW